MELGPEEIVFDTTAAAAPKEDIPDQSARAFRDAAGKVNFICGHYDLYRALGDSLTQTVRDRSRPVWRSHLQTDVNLHDNREWLAATYTEDGRTIHVVVHNEYHGDEVNNLNTKEDRSANGWYNSITYAVSTDGGKNYTHPQPPGHLILAPFIPYDPDRRDGPYGYFEPSNIIRKDGYYYCFVQMEKHGAQDGGTGLLRTSNLADLRAWTAWDGKEFSPIDPVTRRAVRPLGPISRQRIGKLHTSVTWNTHFNAFIMVGMHETAEKAGIFYTLSDNLIDWSEPRLVLETRLSWRARGDEWGTAYASLLDPEDATRNFERTGRDPYLYYIVWQVNVDSTRRKIIRRRVHFRRPTAESSPDRLETGVWRLSRHRDGRLEPEGTVHELAKTQPATSPAAHNGSLVLDYAFDTPGHDAAMITRTGLSIRGARRMQLTVWGDQSGHELFIVLTDAGGEQHLLATRTILDWEGPRRITLDLDPLRHPPPKLVVTCDHWGGDGNQVLDDPVTAVTIGIHDRPDDREGRGRVRVADLAFIESGGR